MLTTIRNNSKHGQPPDISSASHAADHSHEHFVHQAPGRICEHKGYQEEEECGELARREGSKGGKSIKSKKDNKEEGYEEHEEEKECGEKEEGVSEEKNGYVRLNQLSGRKQCRIVRK